MSAAQDSQARAACVGVITGIGKDPEPRFAESTSSGFRPAIGARSFDDETVKRLRAALDRYKSRPLRSLPVDPDLKSMTSIAGRHHRRRPTRIPRRQDRSDQEDVRFAERLWIPAVQTHCGFIPENPNDPLYKETVAAYARSHRTATPNTRVSGAKRDRRPRSPSCAQSRCRVEGIGVNFDPANLIMYGKANPVMRSRCSGLTSRGNTRKTGFTDRPEIAWTRGTRSGKGR
jgi:hypothetical protein